MENIKKEGFFEKPLLRTRIKSSNVKFLEMLFGYFVPLGALFASGIFTSFLNYYWTDVLFKGNVTEEVKSFLFWLPFVSTFLIIIGNLVAGQLIEKTKTKAGKARPWILLSSILLGVACVTMFIAPSDNLVVKMVLSAISYNLYYAIAYPLYNTANSTLIPVSTRNSKQRGLLASFTNVAGLAVMGAGSMVFPIIQGAILGDKLPYWTVTFVIVGILSFICCVLQYYFTRERVTEETYNEIDKKEKISVKKQLKASVNEKYWWIIIIFYLIFQFSGAFKNLSMVYFCNSILDNSFWGANLDASTASGMTQSLLAILGAIPMAVAVIFIWPLSNKIGKQKVTMAGMVIGVIGGIIEIIGGSNVVIVSVGVALKCLGSAPACYMILAMISDVLDHMEAKNGFRCDGFTMSIYSSIMVAATGFCTAIFNAISNAGANKVAVSISYVWIETIAYAVCLILLLFFNVENKLQEDQQIIINRQKELCLARGETWIEPQERLRLEQEQAEKEAEENRIKELKDYCLRKNKDFEVEEAKYQAKHNKKK